MSPEQMKASRNVDVRSDIWSLGVILYELLTGSPPFTADTMPELVLRVVQGAPPAPLRSRRPDAPPALE
jgi:serine/threonine-protein kinase